MSTYELFTCSPRTGYSNVNPLRRIIPHFGHEIRFMANFDESVKYTAINEKEQSRWHKLTGYREATLKDNSGRAGFRWYQDQLQFCLYVHCNGENLGALDPPVLYFTTNVKEGIYGTITADGDRYRLKINGHPADEQRGGAGLFRFMCWPFADVKFLPGKEQSIKIKMKFL